MLGSLSPEAKIKSGLLELGCAEQNFAAIAGVIGRSRLAQGLNGLKDFERDDATRMLEILVEMFELQQSAGDAPIDWSQVSKVELALVTRRMKKVLQELDQESVSSA